MILLVNNKKKLYVRRVLGGKCNALLQRGLVPNFPARAKQNNYLSGCRLAIDARVGRDRPSAPSDAGVNVSWFCGEIREVAKATQGYGDLRSVTQLQVTAKHVYSGNFYLVRSADCQSKPLQQLERGTCALQVRVAGLRSLHVEASGAGNSPPCGID